MACPRRRSTAAADFVVPSVHPSSRSTSAQERPASILASIQSGSCSWGHFGTERLPCGSSTPSLRHQLRTVTLSTPMRRATSAFDLPASRCASRTERSGAGTQSSLAHADVWPPIAGRLRQPERRAGLAHRPSTGNGPTARVRGAAGVRRRSWAEHDEGVLRPPVWAGCLTPRPADR